MCLAALAMNAQRCAVLDFQVGTGVSEEEIDAISYNFRSNFRPSGFTMIEGSLINRTIKDFEFNRTDMTMQQMLKVGRNLDANIIIVGTMNKLMEEYSIDLRAVNVSTGTTVASESASFGKSDYRKSMENLADKLGRKIATSPTTQPVTKPATDKNGFVDLGLPSGTKWRKDNEEGGYYTYERALNTFKFSGKLPTKEQFEELKDQCEWRWTGSGYKVTGPNGNSITLPAAGFRNCSGSVSNVGSGGYYWSSASYSSESAWDLGFNSGGLGVGCGNRCVGQSVRLVQD